MHVYIYIYMLNTCTCENCNQSIYIYIYWLQFSLVHVFSIVNLPFVITEATFTHCD